MTERLKEFRRISPYVGYNMKNEFTPVNRQYSVAIPDIDTPIKTMVINNMRHSLNFLKNPESFNDHKTIKE